MSMRSSGRSWRSFGWFAILLLAAGGAAADAYTRIAQDVLRVVLTDRRLVHYLNFKATPVLRIRNRTEVDFGRPAFTVEGHPIALVAIAEDGDPDAVEITRAALAADEAWIALRYRRQGIRVQAQLVRTPAGWRIDRFRLVEN